MLAMKLGRLQWAGHVARMDEEAIYKMLLAEPLHTPEKEIGKLKLRW